MTQKKTLEKVTCMQKISFVLFIMSDIQGIIKLELLSNEILIEYIEYLNAFDIFHSFDQLNSRFNNVICHILLHIVFQYVNKSILYKNGI